MSLSAPPAASAPPRARGVRSWAALAPLWSSDVYATLLSAQLVAILGRWMQLLGAQWFFIDEDPSMVALVSTALFLPNVIFAPLAGAVADMTDRRRMVVLTQAGLFVTALVIAALSLLDLTTSWLMLALMFVMGTGIAVNMPPWQSVQSDVVPREHLVQAATLTAVGANVGRAVGPALGGAMVALTGVGGVFAVAAATYGVAFTLTSRVREVPQSQRLRERLGEALRAGSRYTRHSATTRRILLWTFVFVSINSALWALLPTIADRQLDLNAAGYGLLLGAVGAGALVGALLMPAAKQRWSADRVFTLSILAIGASTVGVTLMGSPWLAGLLLLPVGAAYIAVIALLNATLQLMLPSWVRARGLAIYSVVFHAAIGGGSAAWGFLADGIGADTTVAVSGASLLAFVPVSRWLVFPATRIVEDAPLTGWIEPQLALDVSAREGAVTVMAVYRVPEEHRAEFARTMIAIGEGRRRIGAFRHEILQEGSSPETFVELFVVPSWSDYVRQQAERRTVEDRALEQRARHLASQDVVERHWFPSQGGTMSDEVRVTVDHNTCVGSATCTSIAPAVFHLNADRQAEVAGDGTAPAELTREAADGCPVGAITVHPEGVGA